MTAALLEVAGLGAQYGRVVALHDATLAVAAGELVALVGGNGAGKTTLLRTISGVRPASAGSIRFEGRDITRLAPARRVGLGIVQVPEGRQVFAPLSVEDNLRLGAYARGRERSAEGLARAYRMFPALRQKRDLPAGSLSGGQQQMLAIARGLMAEPRLLLLDEPSMGLAPLLIAEIFAAIADLKRAGATILLVEQNATQALKIADRAYVLETGRVVLEGSGATLAQNERVKAAYLGM
ncbi:MAG: ABC transporter ATP-binding protein [Alphaproteobacteria bacterium]|nr:ABC transporter ATP-binding protein [Alphaproteobacteria bacterium]